MLSCPDDEDGYAFCLLLQLLFLFWRCNPAAPVAHGPARDCLLSSQKGRPQKGKQDAAGKPRFLLSMGRVETKQEREKAR